MKKHNGHPRIYAYSITDQAHKGLLKIGQTKRNVTQRVGEQLRTATISNYQIELDEAAERDDGTFFTDSRVRAALAKKGCANAGFEWMQCSVEDVKTVLTELRAVPVNPFRAWRTQHRLTHEHVAAELRVHRNTVANWEDDAGSPKPKQLKLLEKRWPGLLRRIGLIPRTEAT